jgi:hypothetical protein
MRVAGSEGILVLGHQRRYVQLRGQDKESRVPAIGLPICIISSSSIILD